MATTFLAGSTFYGTSGDWKDWTQKVKWEEGDGRVDLQLRSTFPESRGGRQFTGKIYSLPNFSISMEHELIAGQSMTQ